MYDKCSGFKFWLTAIYALNLLEHRRVHWKKMEDIHCRYKGPWCAVEDFNNVTSALDRIRERW